MSNNIKVNFQKDEGDKLESNPDKASVRNIDNNTTSTLPKDKNIYDKLIELIDNLL